MPPFAVTHVLVAIDFGRTSVRAREAAIGIAQKFGAKLTMIHVCEIPTPIYAGMPYTAADLETPLREAAQNALDLELAEAKKTMPSATALLCVGYPAHEIAEAVRVTGADLLVIGTHGRHGLPRMLLGSVAEKLVRTATAPVLTIHATS